ncbi:MAG: phosphate ABC transporter substrate-binding protein [Candidatus Methanomethylophilaceae archaeon]
MNTNTKIIAVVAVIVIVAAGAWLALGHNNNNGDDTVTITIAGSTTVAPIMMAVEEVYEKENNVDLQITANGSGAGASAAINGTADIGMLSRDLKASEVESGLVSTTIGLDGIAVIINSNVTGVTNLTVEQLAKIYSGEITNWSEVGGNNLKISVISREDGSGTRDGFESAMVKVDSNFEILTEKIEVASTNAVISSVDRTSGSIGYISVGYTSKIGSNTVLLEVNGVEATAENVVNGTYAIQRDLILATKGEPTGEVADLINWILSDAGQALVEEKGYVPLS